MSIVLAFRWLIGIFIINNGNALNDVIAEVLSYGLLISVNHCLNIPTVYWDMGQRLRG